MPLFKFNATATFIEACAYTTQADAAAVAARFPKMCRVRVGTTTASKREWLADCAVQGDSGNWICGSVTFRVNLRADSVNKGANETGMRRWKAFVKAAKAAGYELAYVAPWANSLPEAAALELLK